MKFCSQCGAPLKTDAKFCASCGASVTKTSPTSARDEQPTVAADAPRTASPGAAPWASGSSSRPDVRAAVVKTKSGMSRIPRPVIFTVAAAAAVGIGVSAALMMREAPTMSIDTKQFSQTAPALSQAPTKKWTISSEALANAAGLDSGSSAANSLLDYGTNGLILMSVRGSTSAAVAVEEKSGKALWKVRGDFANCLSNSKANGWVCQYTPPAEESDDTSTSSTPKAQIVSLDNNGRITKVSDDEGSDQLIRDAQGSLWLVSGLDGSMLSDPSDDGASGESATGTTAVKISKLNDDGKPQWQYEKNLTRDQTLDVTGLASLPLFTVDGVTYVRGVKDSDDKGIALDSSGKQTDKAEHTVLGNDRGRVITSAGTNKPGYRVAGEKMKSDTTSLLSPIMIDTADVPLFNRLGSEWQKLNPDGTDVDWKKSIEASPVAYCAKTTVFKSPGESNAWFISEDGKEKWSGSLDGDPAFCWGGSQLAVLDSTTGNLEVRNLADGKTAWSLDLASDQSGSSQLNNVSYSPNTNGFIGQDTAGLTYWGQ